MTDNCQYCDADTAAAFRVTGKHNNLPAYEDFVDACRQHLLDAIDHVGASSKGVDNDGPVLVYAKEAP